MRFAILGADKTTLELARVVAEHDVWELSFLCEQDEATDPRAAELQRALARSATTLNTWEDLLDLQKIDAVIIARAGDEERRSDQLRKFAQLGVPVLMSHPVVSSMLLYYELDMIRRDTGALLFPALGKRNHPAMQELLRVVGSEQSPLGQFEQVAIERSMADRSKRAVEEQFAQDVDLLRVLCGELNQIGAMGTSGEEGVYGNLSVQMTGPHGRMARWAVVPDRQDGTGGATMTLTGSSGRMQVATSDVGSWSTNWPQQPNESQTFAPWNGADTILRQFVRLVQREPLDPGTPDLLDAARCAELTETIARSLRRRRTIDLHFEDHSEENTFKGKMAAAGCLLLMMGLGVLFLAAVLARFQFRIAAFWPWLLAGVFGIFSLLQLLVFVSKK